MSTEIIYFSMPAIAPHLYAVGVVGGAIVVGIGFGLVGWIGVKVWSAIISIQNRHNVANRAEEL